MTQAQDRAWTASVRLGIRESGADPAKLLDSNTFVASLDELADLDPTSPEFAAGIKTATAAWLATHPEAAITAPAGPARMGADITGAGGGGKTRAAGLGAAVADAYRKT
jgi:hypothetical protein